MWCHITVKPFCVARYLPYFKNNKIVEEWKDDPEQWIMKHVKHEVITRQGRLYNTEWDRTVCLYLCSFDLSWVTRHSRTHTLTHIFSHPIIQPCSEHTTDHTNTHQLIHSPFLSSVVEWTRQTNCWDPTGLDTMTFTMFNIHTLLLSAFEIQLFLFGT